MRSEQVRSYNFGRVQPGLNLIGKGLGRQWKVRRIFQQNLPLGIGYDNAGVAVNVPKDPDGSPGGLLRLSASRAGDDSANRRACPGHFRVTVPLPHPIRNFLHLQIGDDGKRFPRNAAFFSRLMPVVCNASQCDQRRHYQKDETKNTIRSPPRGTGIRSPSVQPFGAALAILWFGSFHLAARAGVPRAHFTCVMAIHFG